MTVLERLDACIAGLDHLHAKQSKVAIDNYCRRIDQRLALIVATLDRLSQVDPRIGVRRSPEGIHRALERWAERTVRDIDEAALVRCSERLDQSLSDLTFVLQEGLLDDQA